MFLYLNDGRANPAQATGQQRACLAAIPAYASAKKSSDDPPASSLYVGHY
jgi:hypothetical protein